jgi:hypothetical protein
MVWSSVRRRGLHRSNHWVACNELVFADQRRRRDYNAIRSLGAKRRIPILSSCQTVKREAMAFSVTTYI